LAFAPALLHSNNKLSELSAKQIKVIENNDLIQRIRVDILDLCGAP
jgi:hypothetical protein